jgi:hypothetical protein
VDGKKKEYQVYRVQYNLLLKRNNLKQVFGVTGGIVVCKFSN